jgi:hypothetical protein
VYACSELNELYASKERELQDNKAALEKLSDAIEEMQVG